jgi:ATP-dependent helicase/nuclease subunit A
MTEPKILSLPLPDAAARRRIREELDVDFLVEAGAGSGKTTELVNRMSALVATGTATVDGIAAVTFTRKAAAELRERFQARLEAALRLAGHDAPDPEARERLRTALEDIDRAFVGTIHAFCARLLRERPLEVGLDPGFEELPVEERAGFYRRFWEAYLERLTRDADPVLEVLAEAGLRTSQLYGLFTHLAENPDVAFPAESTAPPSASEVAAVRRDLEAIVGRGRELMPEHEPERGWDSFQKKLRTARFTLDVTGWKRRAEFFDALTLLCRTGTSQHKTTYNRWKDTPLTKDLVARANAFGFGDTPALRLLERWHAHRYALALRLTRRAADEFAEHRRRVGRLDFQDLLLLTARLLRGDAGARSELGRRYRRLLIDEFQDTDPLQAEIMLLLASEPAEEEDAEVPSADWRTAVPRPGALFVVGDPKQSIYRFRRADIQLYEFVKDRFRAFGDVVDLTANFRSRPPIGDLVNEVFDHPDLFPAEATPEQARFEPLRTRPAATPAPEEGVFWYGVHPTRDANALVAEDDAARLSTWIRDRVDAGGRGAGDFLVLTRNKRSLSIYARAMEAHGIPVQVTGAGVGVELELTELMALLECMIDPADPVLVVAVLVGLFFGLDHQRLVDHGLAGGSFDVMQPGGTGDEEVRSALATLHHWWRAASREPADVFLGRVVPELGLLPLAAAGELGAIRAGALVYALDAVRASALAGDASLPGALEAVRAALDAAEAEAPLQPGRPDVVRLMNLHQAKGLEAPVVVLADPTPPPGVPPDLHVERRPDGSAVGWLDVSENRGGFRGSAPLARPPEWSAKQEAEARFDRAEQVRLLYVAATRARDELVVARRPEKPDASAWSPLDAWLVEKGTELVLEARAPRPREALRVAPEEIRERVEAAGARVRRMAEPSFRHVTVTEVAKSGTPEDVPPQSPRPAAVRGAFRGYSWGSAVHGALAAAAADDSEVTLRAACRALLVEHGRPLDDHGEPREVEELLALVRSVRASELWRRAATAGRVLVEVPFAAPGATRAPEPPPPVPSDAPAGNARPQRQLDLFGGATGGASSEAAESGEEPTAEGGADGGPRPAVLEGVIDLAFREQGGWVIADYKTDVGTDPEFPVRLEAYRRQVDLYAEAWARLTGEPVKERVLYFTSQGRVEAW